MQITIDIPEQAIAEAAELGKSLQEYAQGLVQQGRDEMSRERGWNHSDDPEEFVRNLSRYTVGKPALSPDAFSRENFYSDEE